MAIWQFDLSLVERDRLPSRRDDGHEVPELEAKKTNLAKQWLATHFGVHREFTADWFVFGEENGSRVDLLLNEDETSELSARIDARGDASEFIGGICALSLQVGCVFFSAEAWKVVEPNANAVKQALANSRAVAYARDPEGFLRGASNA